MDSVKHGSNLGVKGPYFGAASNPRLTLWAQLPLSAPAPTVSLQIPLSTLEELKKKGVFFSQSCFGRYTLPMHSIPLYLCHPSPRVAPGGHNKRLASLFQLAANRVA